MATKVQNVHILYDDTTDNGSGDFRATTRQKKSSLFAKTDGGYCCITTVATGEGASDDAEICGTRTRTGVGAATAVCFLLRLASKEMAKCESCDDDRDRAT